MKLCYFADASSIHTYRWLDYFARHGHEVHLVSIEERQPGLDWGRITFHHVPELISKKLLPYYALKFKEIVKHITPDLLHAHYATKYGLIAWLTGFHPMILTAWGSDVLLTPNESVVNKLLLKRAMPKADLVTCDGTNSMAALEAMGVDPTKIRLIYFGIDADHFTPNARDDTLRKKLGIAEDGIAVISIRNLAQLYDIKTLIDAIPLVLKKHENTRFIIGGDGPMKEELISSVRSQGLESKVIFTGRLSLAELPNHLASADIFVSTALSDAGLSSSTGEALACGVPVISTPSGDAEAMLKESGAGITIPFHNPSALANAISSLIEDAHLRKKFGIAGRKYIKEKHSYEQNMKCMEEEYFRFLEKTGGIVSR